MDKQPSFRERIIAIGGVALALTENAEQIKRAAEVVIAEVARMEAAEKRFAEKRKTRTTKASR